MSFISLRHVPVDQRRNYFFTYQAGDSRWTYVTQLTDTNRDLYKYCKSCNICYKKSYFSSHKKTQFHKKKDLIKKDQEKKIQDEYNLITAIGERLNVKLKDTDFHIENIIKEYLKDICRDCNQETSNPDYIFSNGVEVNVCQHCRGKYHNCYDKNCRSIGTRFNKCVNCGQTGCSNHLKEMNKKLYCSNCIGIQVDLMFVDTKPFEKLQNDNKNLKSSVKSLTKSNTILLTDNLRQEKFYKEQKKNIERKMQTLQDENQHLKDLLANPDKAHKDEIYKLKAEIDELKREKQREKQIFKSHRDIAEEETRRFMKKYRKEKKKNKKLEKKQLEMVEQIKKEFEEKLKILGMSADITDTHKPEKNESVVSDIESDDEETIEMTPIPPRQKKDKK